jgi:hypothetical protein
MKSLFSVLLVIFLLTCSHNNFDNYPLIFELRIAQSEPSPSLKEMIFYKTSKKFYVSDSVFLSNSDLVSAEFIDW